MASFVILGILVLAVGEVLCAQDVEYPPLWDSNTKSPYPTTPYPTTKSPFLTTVYQRWRGRNTTQTTPWWFVPTSTTPPPYRSTAYPRWRHRTTTNRPGISTTIPWWYVPTSTTPTPYRSTAYPRWRYRTTTTRPSVSTTIPWWYVPTSTKPPPYRSTAYPRWRYRTTTTRPSNHSTAPWWFIPSSTTPPPTTSTPWWFYPSTRRPSILNPWLKPWRSHTTTTSIYDWLETWTRRTTPKPWWSIDSVTTTESLFDQDNDVYTQSPKKIDNNLWDSFTDSPNVNNFDDDDNTYESHDHGGLDGGVVAAIVLPLLIIPGLVALRIFLCYRRVNRLRNNANTRRVVGPCRVLSVTALAAVPDETDSDRVRLIGVRQTRIMRA